MRAVQDVGRDALDQLRHGCSACSATDDGEQPARAAPGPRALDALRRAASAHAGLPVELRVAGEPRTAAAPRVDGAAYRVIQEALTNALKHAGAVPTDGHRSLRADGVAARDRRRRADRARRRAAGGPRARRACASASSAYGGELQRRARPRRRLRRAARACRSDASAQHDRAILIADDQALVRGGLRMILDAQPDLEVVGEAADGRDALQTRAASSRPTSC